MTEYAVKVREFEGPLEVLLDLIEGRKLSINEVSLASVTDEYFTHIKSLEAAGSPQYDEIASFLVVAATLILIKSRSLLAGFEISKEEEADIRELEDRLHAYKIVKIMAEQLGRRAAGRTPLYTRNAAVEEKAFFIPPERLSLPGLLAVLEGLIQTLPAKEELPQKTVKKIISLEEKIEEFRKRIEGGMVKTFGDFVADGKEKIDVVVSFLAMLELIKLGAIAVRQGALFDHIHIEHGSRTK